MILTSEGRLYVWKAINISSKRETHIEVMEKTNNLLAELNDQGIKVCAIVTDSASAYAAFRFINIYIYLFIFFFLNIYYN